MLFRQLFDPQSATYSYLLADEASGEAVLIDPVYEQVRRDSALATEVRFPLQKYHRMLAKMRRWIESLEPADTGNRS